MRKIFLISMILAAVLSSEACAKSPKIFNHAPSLSTLCVLGPPKLQPAWIKSRRPALTAICNYDVNDVVSKVEQLLSSQTSDISIEGVEKILSTPTLSTISSDTRSSVYEIELSGVGGWLLYLNIRESFFPFESRIHKFIPGIYPLRLDQNNKGTLNLIASFRYPISASVKKGTCAQKIDFADYAKKAGWAGTYPIVPPTDGGTRDPSFVSPNGVQFSVVPTFEDGGMCLSQLIFSREPKGKLPIGLRLDTTDSGDPTLKR